MNLIVISRILFFRGSANESGPEHLAVARVIPAVVPNDRDRKILKHVLQERETVSTRCL